MDAISPDIARKLLTRDIANLAQRVQRGGNLSRSERAMLQGMAVSSGPAQATVAENYVELARILGVTRRTIQNWRKRSDAPKPAANGFHEVTAWREFMTRHDLKGDAPAADEETALRARKLLAEVEERELRLAVKKREYVAIEEVRQTWTRQVGRAKELLRNKFENELPPILSGLDATRIQTECRKAIDEVLSILHSGS
jgi:phage terminase Nu1 subunit (DNA packaging protein)